MIFLSVVNPFLLVAIGGAIGLLIFGKDDDAESRQNVSGRDGGDSGCESGGTDPQSGGRSGGVATADEPTNEQNIEQKESSNHAEESHSNGSAVRPVWGGGDRDDLCDQLDPATVEHSQAQGLSDAETGEETPQETPHERA